MAKLREGYIAVFGDNNFEYQQLVLWGWFRKSEMIVITPAPSSEAANIIRRLPFVRRYTKESIKEYHISFHGRESLWYEINEETIDLTLKFYNRYVKDRTNFISYYSRLLNTNKFEAYIKKTISFHIFAILKDLQFVRLSEMKRNRILLIKSPLNEFLVKYMEEKYNIKYKIRWVLPVWEAFSFFEYCRWLLKEFIRRGIVFNKKRRSYKIAKEAVWGFYRLTLRDDIIIDNKRFSKTDILMLELDPRHTTRAKAFEEAKKRSFDTASVPELKINITKNIFNLLFFYIFVPFRVYSQLFFSSQSYLCYYIYLFHKGCFPFEVLMNLYEVKCYISNKDWSDIAETIILNKYGGKNIIFHWSDLTSYNAFHHGFIAHNICFAWGDINYGYHSDSYFVDKKINVGCIFKEGYNKALKNKENIFKQIENLRRERRVVTFFDSSFDNYSNQDEHLFLEYLGLMKEFCKRNKDINVLLKPKSGDSYEAGISEENRISFRDIWDELKGLDNFIYLNPQDTGLEETIAISDVCINMGINSPATVALICGKDALYYSSSGNSYHPFAKKYKDLIVFEDKDLLFKQIDNILNRRFNCRDVISEREIREYDAFEDDNALERIVDTLYRLTKDAA